MHDYVITKEGLVYKDGNPITISWRRDKGTAYVKLHGIKHGLAKLVATHHVPNPRGHRNVVFKDRDKTNCHADNLAWIGNADYYTYCGLHEYRFAAKKYGDRQQAIEACINPDVKEFYKTLDEYWLIQCWAWIDKMLTNLFGWREIKAACYEYFIDRAKRYSIVGDPKGLMIMYAKYARRELSKRDMCYVDAYQKMTPKRKIEQHN